MRILIKESKSHAEFDSTLEKRVIKASDLWVQVELLSAVPIFKLMKSCYVN